jgi:hypothetical protein
MQLSKYIAVSSIFLSAIYPAPGFALKFNLFQSKYCSDERKGNYKRGTLCDHDKLLYCDGGGTCCTPVQSNPDTCQPPPNFRLPRPPGALPLD